MPARIVKPYSRPWSQMRGAGDVVEKLLAPIAMAVAPDCHDKETGELKPASPCGQRRDSLNKVLPFKTKPE